MNKKTNQNNRLQKARLVMIIAMALITVAMFYVRFRYTTEERMEKYFYDNKASFLLLKEELLSINENKIRQPKNNLRQQAKTNHKIDSLQNELYIRHIGLSFDENYIVTIHFTIDFNNYIDPFEYWYSDFGLKEFEHDGVSFKKLDHNWGVFSMQNSVISGW